jgi:ribonuclease R
VGAEFKGRINGVTRAGLFVTLDETGADGFIPMRSLGDDFYIHDESRHCLRGRRTGRVYTLGDSVTARLSEADTVTGSLQFTLVGDGPGSGRAPKDPRHQGRRRR